MLGFGVGQKPTRDIWGAKKSCRLSLYAPHQLEFQKLDTGNQSRFRITKKGEPLGQGLAFSFCQKLVRMRGLEPPRCRHHRLLRPARLPVPPHPHAGNHYANALKECQETASYLSTRQSIVSRGINGDDAKRGFADPDSSFDYVGSGHRQSPDYGACECEWD
jgi:hypothetical protein